MGCFRAIFLVLHALRMRRIISQWAFADEIVEHENGIQEGRGQGENRQGRALTCATHEG